jgi:hypothetical protein
MIIWSGIINPEGSSVGYDGICKVQDECETIKRAHKHQSVSRMWVRLLNRLFLGFVKYGTTLLLVALVGFTLYTTMMGG